MIRECGLCFWCESDQEKHVNQIPSPDYGECRHPLPIMGPSYMGKWNIVHLKRGWCGNYLYHLEAEAKLELQKNSIPLPFAGGSQ